MYNNDTEDPGKGRHWVCAICENPTDVRVSDGVAYPVMHLHLGNRCYGVNAPASTRANR